MIALKFKTNSIITLWKVKSSEYIILLILQKKQKPPESDFCWNQLFFKTEVVQVLCQCCE